MSLGGYMSHSRCWVGVLEPVGAAGFFCAFGMAVNGWD